MKIVQALLLVLSIFVFIAPSTFGSSPIKKTTPRMKLMGQLIVGAPKFYDLKDPIIKQGMVSIALLHLPSRFKPSQVYVYVTEASTIPSLYPTNLELKVQVIQKGKGKQSQDAQCQMSFNFPSSGIKLLQYSCMPISS